MTNMTHWRMYFSCPIGDNGAYYVEVEGRTAERMMEAIKAAEHSCIPVITKGKSGQPSRELHVDFSQVVALEPRKD